MGACLPPIGTQFALEAAAIDGLIGSLTRREYEVIGPAMRGDAIAYGPVRSSADLPAGMTLDVQPGRVRAGPRQDGALFGYPAPAQSWKRFLHPPEAPLFEARRDGAGGLRFVAAPSKAPKQAFLGVRACELAAIAIQDRVLVGEPESDDVYQARRRNVFLVAVNCTTPSPLCFCRSLRTCPPAEAGFDIALTEVIAPDLHVFVAEAGSRAGAEVLAELEKSEATSELRRMAERAVKAALAEQTRHIDTARLRETLYEQFDHPNWDRVAERCLSCGNCTQVCPTCFCTTVEDGSDFTGTIASRRRRWDSCFTQSFTYIHGGSVRMSAKSRYRQWLTHKLGAWVDQFGSVGCVGCGRCIAWCPAGIDITEEAAALRDSGGRAGLEGDLK